MIILGNTKVVFKCFNLPIGQIGLSSGLPFVKDLLSEIQSPIEAGRIVIDQFGIWHFLPNGIDQFGHFSHMRVRRFDPKQIGTVFQAGNAVQNGTVESGIRFETVQTVGQTCGLAKFSVQFH